MFQEVETIHQKLNGTLSTDPQVSCDRAIRYSGFHGVRSVGPVGDFLENSFLYVCYIPDSLEGGPFYNRYSNEVITAP